MPFFIGASLVAAIAVLALALSADEPLPGPSAELPDPEVWPAIDIVVPVRDEREYIAGKVADLRALDYPAGALAFRIVDGASRDGTLEMAAEAVGADRRFHCTDAGAAGKTVQINFALRHCRADWVLVTDADARLESDTLKRLVRDALSGPPAGAVGATVTPSSAHPWEMLHWRVADRRRLREAAAGGASIVTGPCYLLRRSLLNAFPGDVIADDVHAAFRSAAAGLRTGFVRADIVELRSPRTLAELLPHKYRKAHAYVREIFRFLPRSGRMAPAGRGTFVRHAALVVLAPVGAALLAASAIAAARWFGPGAVAAAPVGLLFPAIRRRAGLAALLTTALAAGIITAPFLGRGAAYPKVDRRRKPSPQPETP